jgi:hypothetical protein
MKEKLFFEKSKEHRGDHFVEYSPLYPGENFAHLEITFLSEQPLVRVIEVLNQEIDHWMRRYPVTLMAAAFDDTGGVIDPTPDIHGLSLHLVGWIDEGGDIGRSFNVGDIDPSHRPAPTNEALKAIYHDISYKTELERRQKINVKIRARVTQYRIVKILFLTWACLIPAGYLIFEQFGPEWVAYAALVFAFWKLIRTGLKLFGLVKPSRAENKASEEQLRMRHYFVHCERNPNAFARLRSENLAEDLKKGVIRESDEIRLLRQRSDE